MAHLRSLSVSSSALSSRTFPLPSSHHSLERGKALENRSPPTQKAQTSTHSLSLPPSLCDDNEWPLDAIEEMGSSYPTREGGSSPKSSPGSSDSLNGLKFGQKIYFGDVGLAVSGISGGGSSSVSSPPASVGGGSGGGATPGRKGRGIVQSGQPPRCQVEGCNVDLSDAKAYYSRHKVCCMHSKSSKVTVGGIEQRFCQQCSRFHQLAEFDHGKRSCRRRLAGHNERRRKPPPGSFLSSRSGRFSPSIFDGGSRSGGFLVDFTANPKTPGRSSWPGNPSSPPTEMFPQSPAGGANYQVGPTIPSGECFAGVTDSGCALSLLSNQHWSSGTRAPCTGPSTLLNTGGPSMGHFADGSWGFRPGEASNGLTGMPADLGLCQVSQPLGSRFSDNQLDTAQPGGSGGRQVTEFGHSSPYGSSHWSL